MALANLPPSGPSGLPTVQRHASSASTYGGRLRKHSNVSNFDDEPGKNFKIYRKYLTNWNNNMADNSIIIVGSNYDATILYDGKGVHLKPLNATNDNTYQNIDRRYPIHNKKQRTILLGGHAYEIYTALVII